MTKIRSKFSQPFLGANMRSCDSGLIVTCVSWIFTSLIIFISFQYYILCAQNWFSYFFKSKKLKSFTAKDIYTKLIIVESTKVKTKIFLVECKLLTRFCFFSYINTINKTISLCNFIINI